MFNTATQLRFTTTCICTSSHLVTDGVTPQPWRSSVQSSSSSSDSCHCIGWRCLWLMSVVSSASKHSRLSTADVHGRREPVLVAHPGVVVLISSRQIITSLTRSLIGEQTPLTHADRQARPVVYIWIMNTLTERRDVVQWRRVLKRFS